MLVEARKNAVIQVQIAPDAWTHDNTHANMTPGIDDDDCCKTLPTARSGQRD
jgi:hypothetical protein